MVESKFILFYCLICNFLLILQNAKIKLISIITKKSCLMHPLAKHIFLSAALAFSLFSGVPAHSQPSGSQLKLKTVVIDAGHGGKDAGAVSFDKKTYEKNVTLAIAKLLGQKIENAYPDVKVVYTRTTDRFVELNDRAEIANRNNADLFISIHINSFTKTSPNGFSAHILGQSSNKNRDLFSFNQELCRRENSVILLEDDYETKYQGFNPNDPESFIMFNLMQNAFYEQSILFAAEVDSQLSKGPFRTNRGISQNPFYVLWKTAMPSVLLELGFISNPSDLKVLNSSSGREEIATRLFNAFSSFKKKYDGSLDYRTDAKPAVQQPAGEKVMYGVQVLLLSRKLKPDDRAFKGYEAEVFQSGKMYKYIIGTSSTEDGARKFMSSVRKKFPDSFIVKIENGEVTRL